MEEVDDITGNEEPGEGQGLGSRTRRKRINGRSTRRDMVAHRTVSGSGSSKRRQDDNTDKCEFISITDGTFLDRRRTMTEGAKAAVNDESLDEGKCQQHRVS